MTDEDAMVAAHKHGLRMYEILHGDGERADLYVLERYDTVHEREAFLAGFIGARKRDIQEFRR